jgi:hypothetical protein
MGKPNRIHKPSGLVAIFNNEYGQYMIEKGTAIYVIPDEIAESEGWENDKSELEKLLDNIDRQYNFFASKDIKIRVEVRGLIQGYLKSVYQQSWTDRDMKSFAGIIESIAEHVKPDIDKKLDEFKQSREW